MTPILPAIRSNPPATPQPFTSGPSLDAKSLPQIRANVAIMIDRGATAQEIENYLADEGVTTAEIRSTKPAARSAADMERIKGNLRKIIDGGGSEAEGDRYLAGEGLTAGDLRSKPAVQPSSSQILPPFREALEEAAKMGRRGDTDIVHINPAEKRLLELHGGSGTRNPATGLLEYYEAKDGHDFGGGLNDRGGLGGASNGGGRTGNGGGGGKKGMDYGALSNIGTGNPLGPTAATVEGPVSPWGAPVHTDQYGIQWAKSPQKWGDLKNRVDAYNQAAREWNAGTGRSLANFANEMGVMGLHMVAPDFNQPATYTGGTYHTGLNPGELAGGLLGGALFPGGGLIGGTIGGKVYDAVGGGPIMLGGPSVPSGWTGPGMPGSAGAAPAPQASAAAPKSSVAPPAGGSGKTENAGTGLLPPIAGNPAAQTSVVLPSSGSSLPPLSAPATAAVQGGWQEIPGPSRYGWTMPSWIYRV
jgi:hypothetical protein